MIQNKRINLFAGHYGSGKTNIAVNYALTLAAEGHAVTIADLDIVNPYYRTKDSAQQLEAAGIRLISSRYANTNVDLPALPQQMYAVTEDQSRRAVIDVGGDDRGALALGRLAPAILAENDYEMLAVINRSRPLTRTPADTAEVLREIEEACGIGFTGIVNNTNLGPQTTADLVLGSLDYAKEVGALCGLPVRLTTVSEKLYNTLKDQINSLMPLQLQKTIW